MTGLLVSTTTIKRGVVGMVDIHLGRSRELQRGLSLGGESRCGWLTPSTNTTKLTLSVGWVKMGTQFEHTGFMHHGHCASNGRLSSRASGSFQSNPEGRCPQNNHIDLFCDSESHRKIRARLKGAPETSKVTRSLGFGCGLVSAWFSWEKHGCALAITKSKYGSTNLMLALKGIKSPQTA